MLIHRINLNHLNVFIEVYNSKSMTTAANTLNLTQSGVSQHIKSLEDSLGVVLFDRIHQKLIPTQPANSLYAACSKSFEDIERNLREIKGDDSGLSGTIAIGMPVEFGNNLVIPLLSKFGLSYPNVKFEVYFEYAKKINDLLLKGQIDFAFVDDYKMDKRIKTKIIYTEKLYLCASKEYVESKKKKNRKEFFESLSYIDYQRGAPVLNMWFEHHLGKKLNLDIRANVMDVHGVSQFILSHFGAGILPLHIIRSLQKDGNDIHIFEGSNKDLINNISVASIENRTLSYTAETCLDFLTKRLEKTVF